jgi:hypothetical protein
LHIAFTLAFAWWAVPGYAGLLSAGTAVGAGNGGCLGTTASGAAGPISVDDSCATEFGSSRGSASADFGSLGVSVQHTVNGQGRDQGGLATAQFFADDYEIAGPAGSIQTRLNFSLSGRVLLDCLDRFASCGASLTVKVIAGPSESFGNVSWFGDGSVVTEGIYDLRSFLGPDIELLELSTPLFTVQTGVPFQVDMRLGSAGGVRGSGRVISEFDRALTYRSDGPVFDLPDGYTANGLGVIDNRFGEDTKPAPEPESLSLVLVAAAGLCVVRRRRPSMRPGIGGVEPVGSSVYEA